MPDQEQMPPSRGRGRQHPDDLATARQRRRAPLAMAGAATMLLSANMVWATPTRLVWNTTASAPTGLYQVQPHMGIARGDMVIAWSPQPARALAASRHYLPANVPLVKRVAAAAGDRVCASGRRILINGRRVASRMVRDSAGRPMPWWRGCRTLGQRDLFLLNDHPNSFDGRYFGVTDTSGLIGRAKLLWAR